MAFDSAKPTDQARLRLVAAGMLKAFILARSKGDTGFLTTGLENDWWKAGDPRPNISRRSTTALLTEAWNKLKRFHEDFSGAMDSISNADNDPLEQAAEDLRSGVLEFARPSEVETQLGRLSKGELIDWNSVANWGSLNELRRLLNQLPHNVVADGPFLPDGFRFEGNEYRGCPPKAWGVINYLWNRPGRCATFGDLSDPVWGGDPVDEGNFGSARSDANGFFKKNHVPYIVRGKNSAAELVDTRGS